MIRILRTNSKNQDFIDLVKLLDVDLAVKDGDDHTFYNAFNKLDSIKYVVLAFDDEQPLGCGAIKEYAPNVMEIKRMFVLPANQGKGIGSKVLCELENWANELSFEKCILETGVNQPDAVALYKKNGYELIPNYGQYANAENSFCFEKQLRRTKGGTRQKGKGKKCNAELKK